MYRMSFLKINPKVGGSLRRETFDLKQQRSMYVCLLVVFGHVDFAAIKIQAAFRGHRGRGEWRKKHREWKKNSRAARRIQKVL